MRKIPKTQNKTHVANNRTTRKYKYQRICLTIQHYIQKGFGAFVVSVDPSNCTCTSKLWIKTHSREVNSYTPVDHSNDARAEHEAIVAIEGDAVQYDLYACDISALPFGTRNDKLGPL